MDAKKLGIIGLLATGVGAVASIVSSIVSKKQQENTIKTEVAKAVAELASKNETI